MLQTIKLSSSTLRNFLFWLSHVCFERNLKSTVSYLSWDQTLLTFCHQSMDVQSFNVHESQYNNAFIVSWSILISIIYFIYLSIFFSDTRINLVRSLGWRSTASMPNIWLMNRLAGRDGTTTGRNSTILVHSHSSSSFLASFCWSCTPSSPRISTGNLRAHLPMRVITSGTRGDLVDSITLVTLILIEHAG